MVITFPFLVHTNSQRKDCIKAAKMYDLPVLPLLNQTFSPIFVTFDVLFAYSFFLSTVIFYFKLVSLSFCCLLSPYLLHSCLLAVSVCLLFYNFLPLYSLSFWLNYSLSPTCFVTAGW